MTTLREVAPGAWIQIEGARPMCECPAHPPGEPQFYLVPDVRPVLLLVFCAYCTKHCGPLSACRRRQWR
jgi:hypothetical protein